MVNIALRRRPITPGEASPGWRTFTHGDVLRDSGRQRGTNAADAGQHTPDEAAGAESLLAAPTVAVWATAWMTVVAGEVASQTSRAIASTYCCATIASGAYNRGHRLMNHASSDGEPTATSHWLDIVRARRSARTDLIDQRVDQVGLRTTDQPGRERRSQLRQALGRRFPAMGLSQRRVVLPGQLTDPGHRTIKHMSETAADDQPPGETSPPISTCG